MRLKNNELDASNLERQRLRRERNIRHDVTIPHTISTYKTSVSIPFQPRGNHQLCPSAHNISYHSDMYSLPFIHMDLQSNPLQRTCSCFPASLEEMPLWIQIFAYNTQRWGQRGFRLRRLKKCSSAFRSLHKICSDEVRKCSFGSTCIISLHVESQFEGKQSSSLDFTISRIIPPLRTPHHVYMIHSETLMSVVLILFIIRLS